MKMWLYGLPAVLAILVFGCEAAGAGDGNGNSRSGDGTGDGLPGSELTVSGTVTKQIDLNNFLEIDFDYPSEEVLFYLIDSGQTGSLSYYDAPFTRDYTFNLNIPLPDETALQAVPRGISSSDPEARILTVDLYGARVDAMVYGESEVLAYGAIDGFRTGLATVTARVLRYIYADRATTLEGTDPETAILVDELSLEPGWNEVIQTSEFEFDRSATLIGITQTMANGEPPRGSQWLLIGNYLPGQIESQKNSSAEQGVDAAAYLAFDSDGFGEQEIFIRAVVGESISLSIPGNTDIRGREVLIYLRVKDSDNSDGLLDNSEIRTTPDYVLGSDDGTDLSEVFVLVYSDGTNEQLAAGTRSAGEATSVDGTPLEKYLQSTNATLIYDDSQGYRFEFRLATASGEVAGTFQSVDLRSYDYADSEL